MAFAKERKAFDKYLKELDGKLPECSKCPYKPKAHYVSVMMGLCFPCGSFKANRDYEKKEEKFLNPLDNAGLIIYIVGIA